MIRGRTVRAAMTSFVMVALVVGAFASACSGDGPVHPVFRAPASPQGIGVRLDCAADVRAASVSCGSARQASGGASLDVATTTLGGQGTYVFLSSTNAAYSSGTTTLSADFTVQNLTAQRLGTDGSGTTGVKVFFVSGPTVTGGTGTVSIANADGTGTFTASNQSYFLYNEVLDVFGGTSAPKNWKFTVPATVTFFTFSVLVQAQTPDEFGVLRWLLELGPPAISYGIWAADSRNVFAVGGIVITNVATGATFAGWVDRWDGTKWSSVAHDVGDTRLEAVWGTSPRNVWAVGTNGGIVHYDGQAWTKVTSPVTTTLNGIWGTSATNIWAVGFSGVILHYNGTSWSTATSGVAVSLNNVHGTGPSDVWVAGNSGTLLHFDGNNWSSVASGTGNFLGAVFAVTPTNAWAGGSGGLLLQYDGATWSSVASPTDLSIFGMSGTSASDIWAVGQSGLTMHFNGTSWTIVSTPAGSRFASVSAAAANDVWAVGRQTVPLHWDGTSWTSFGRQGPTAPPNQFNRITGIWGTSASNIYTCDNQGVVLHYSGNGWIQNTEKPEGRFRSVHGTGPNDIWFVGDSGLAGNWDGIVGQGGIVATGTTRHLRQVWARTEADVWAVGDTQTVVHYDGAAFSVVAAPAGSYDLYGLWGTAANNIWAVGTGGTILKYDGSTWSSVASPTSLWLRRVWGSSATDIWAVGDGGVIIHSSDGATWSTVTSPVTTGLWSVFGTSANNVWAVGVSGIMLHWNGVAWSKQPSGTSSELQTVWATSASNVYVAGLGPVILHGVR